eukprot:129322-Rhodomonas_salina.1
MRCLQVTDSLEVIVSGMKNDADSELAQVAGCKQLIEALKQGAANAWADEPSRLEAIPVVVAAMTAHKASMEMQRQGCEALDKLSATSTGRQAVRHYGGIKAIVEGMTEQAQDDAVQVWGCKTLLCLAQEPAMRMQIAQQEGIKAVVRGMQRHSQVEEVAKKGCELLCHLAKDQAIRVRIADEGGIKVLVAGMRGQTLNIWSGRALGLLAESESLRPQIAEEGGIEAVCKWIKQSFACREGWSALAKLANDKTCRQEIAETAGMVEDVVSAMQFCDEQQHIAGSTLLRCLAKSEDLRKMIVDEGGVAAILHGMSKSQPEAVAAGCRALRALAKDCKSLTQIARDDGIKSVVAAMQGLKGDGTVQKEGCELLCYLGFCQPNLRERIVWAGGVEAVVHSFRHHTLGEVVHTHAFETWADLGQDKENRMVLAKAGCIKVVVNAMQMHETAEVHEAGCKVLLHLAATEINRANIAKDGGITA